MLNFFESDFLRDVFQFCSLLFLVAYVMLTVQHKTKKNKNKTKKEQQQKRENTEEKRNQRKDESSFVLFSAWSPT